jgi:hypothetical protein
VQDPFVVGQAIGAGFVLAVLAFVVARKLCGPAGARHLARLNRLAGEEVEEARFSLYLRDWLPYVAAFLALVVGGLFSFVKAGGLRQNFSSGDMPQLIAGFQSGCQKRCLAERDASFCAGFCDCTFATLRAKHPSDDAFAKWMQAGPQNLAAVQTEVMSAQSACLAALEPSSAPAQQPPSVAPTPTPQPAPGQKAEELDLGVPQYEPAVLARIHEDLEPFLKWAATAKVHPEKLAGTEICATASEPSAGICTKSIAGPAFSDEVYSASYKPGVLGAVRLAVDIPVLMGCDALGPSRTLAQWRHGKTEKQLCEISSGTLGGLQLLAVRSRLGTSLFAFTPSYLAHDPGFRATASQAP